MNKVVCNVCGTSYPENATQCPICGFVRAVEQGSGTQERAEGSYTHVKGGRYSKTNVRKRTQVSQSVETLAAAEDILAGKPKKATRAGSVVTIIVLLIAILLVVGYIVLRFLVPNDFLYVGLDNFAVPTAQTSQTEATQDEADQTDAVGDQTIPCTSITLSYTEAELDSVAGSLQLTVGLDPVDTTDTLQFASDDTSVAVVDDNGNITAVGEGNTVIRVTCGQMSAQCIVTCVAPSTEPDITVPTVELILNRKEITFHTEGESWMLYDGSIAVSAILWSSDDDSIATITDGKVVAVADGTTTVYGTYEDQTVSCIIHCNFNDENIIEGNGGISEAGGDSIDSNASNDASDNNHSYRLYNPYGNAEDVTIQIDEAFTLVLVDENDSEVTDAVWSVSDESVCSYEDSTVTGLDSGYAEISATFKDNTYTCIVRVD